jgi:phosphoadenosine phosphosulfate reductase
MNLEQKANLSRNIIEHAVEEYGKIFMSFSGGKDSVVLLDLVLAVAPDIKVIGIDTGYEFEETIKFTDETIKSRGLDFEYLRPTDDQVSDISRAYSGQDVLDGQWYCCAMKGPALNNFLDKGEYDGWITGLRADETENRKMVGIYQKGKIRKINPIIFWTLDDIWTYINEKGLQYHPKYDEGYKSLGCKPCTEAGFRDGKANQGKFEDVGVSGERPDSAECGLHLEK